MGNRKSKIWKWVIRISLFLLILLILFLVLYFTGNLDTLLNKTKKEVNNWTVISITFVVLLFIWDIFKGWITDYITDLVFPSKIEETVKAIEDTTITINFL